MPEVVTNITTSVIPQWKAWQAEINAFPPTLAIFSAINIGLAIAVVWTTHMIWWEYAIQAVIYALTTISYLSVLRTYFSVSLGYDLLYNTVWALNMVQKTKSSVAVDQLVSMTRNMTIWNKLTGEHKTTPTAEFEI